MNRKWNPARLRELNKLYSSGLSMKETAEKLDTSLSAINSTMRRNKIHRRTPAQTNKINFLKSPLSYRKKEKLSPFEKSLHLAGLMLYWAEGAKTGHTVDFANSNAIMNKIFLEMLRNIYQVNEQRLRILLYCYSNQSSESLLHHWSEFLKIPLEQFTKPYIRYDFDISKSQKMAHGLIHIRYADSRLLSQIIAEIDIIASGISRGGRAIKYTAL